MGPVELDGEAILGASLVLNLSVTSMIRVDHEGPVFRFQGTLVQCSHAVHIVSVNLC